MTHKIGIILSTTPWVGWALQFDDPFLQKPLATFQEFVKYVEEKKWDILTTAIIGYLGVSEDTDFILLMDDNGLEQIQIIPKGSIMMSAKPFDPNGS
jgi:hypothetical protein